MTTTPATATSPPGPAARLLGALVTLDGPGGVGKSTTTTLLTRALAESGWTVHGTRQPSGGTLGELARHGTDTYRGMALACLCAADRHHQLATEILPALAGGTIVVCDRYVASSLVLQGIDDIPAATVWQLNQGIYQPDLSIILTADPQVIHARLHARGGHSRFERAPDAATTESALYQRAEAELLARNWPVAVLDTTTAPPATVAARIVSLLHPVLADRSPACP